MDKANDKDIKCKTMTIYTKMDPQWITLGTSVQDIFSWTVVQVYVKFCTSI